MAAAQQLEKPKAPQVDTAAVVRLVMATCTPDDEALIRTALGDASVTSIPEVARIFNVKESTVRNTWRRDGMPGDARRGPGQRCRFVLADVVMWALKRGAAADEGRARARGFVRDDSVRRELEGIEVQVARLRLHREQSRNARESGSMADVSQLRADIAANLGWLRDAFLEVPRLIRPMLPAKGGDIVAAEVDRFIRNFLITLSERCWNAVPNPNGEPNNVDDDDQR